MRFITYFGTCGFADGEDCSINLEIWRSLFFNVEVKLDQESYGNMDKNMYQSLEISVDLDDGRVILYMEGDQKNILARGRIK